MDFREGSPPFVQARSAFVEVTSREPRDSFAWSWLGRLDVLADDLAAAELHFGFAQAGVQARLMNEDANEVYTGDSVAAQWDLDRERIQARRMGLGEASSNLSGDAGEPKAPFFVRPVRRVHWSNLSTAVLEEQFLDRSEAVVITGLAEAAAQKNTEAASEVPHWSSWTMHSVAAACDFEPAPLKRWTSSSKTWAGLEASQDPGDDAITLSRFVESLTEAASSPTGLKEAMVFDMPLTRSCPTLMKGFAVPAALADVCSYYGPSLFLQPAGTRCGVHVDSGATDFWQLLLQGRKKWRVLRLRQPEDRDSEGQTASVKTDVDGAWARLLGREGWQRSFFPDPRWVPIYNLFSWVRTGRL